MWMSTSKAYGLGISTKTQLQGLGLRASKGGYGDYIGVILGYMGVI